MIKYIHQKYDIWANNILWIYIYISKMPSITIINGRIYLHEVLTLMIIKFWNKLHLNGIDIQDHSYIFTLTNSWLCAVSKFWDSSSFRFSGNQVRIVDLFDRVLFFLIFEIRFTHKYSELFNMQVCPPHLQEPGETRLLNIVSTFPKFPTQGFLLCACRTNYNL